MRDSTLPAGAPASRLHSTLSSVFLRLETVAPFYHPGNPLARTGWRIELPGNFNFLLRAYHAFALHTRHRERVVNYTTSSDRTLAELESALSPYVWVTGFEPATSASRTRRSTKLSHTQSSNGQTPCRTGSALVALDSQAVF